MRMSDLITQEIIKMLNESGANTAEIQRNEFANTIGCAPSQIIMFFPHDLRRSTAI